jgi:hypothetical protein
MDTTFQKMADDSEGSTFTSTDAANMRKNLTELAFLLGMMMIAALFKMGIDDDDDDPDAKKKRPAVNFLVNYAARLQTDILFYTSPVEFERLTKNAVPMFRIVTDSMETINALTQLITKGFDEDLLMSGTNKGESKTWNEAKDMLPIFSHIEKFPKAAQMIYKK